MLAVLWLAGGLVALFVPEDVLDMAVIRSYLSLVLPFANPKGLMASRSDFPQVTLVYNAVVVWSLPAWVAVWWKWMNGQVGRDESGILFRRRLSLGNRLGLVVLLPLWMGLAYAGLTLNHGGDARLFAFGTSRVQLALFGMASPLAGATALVLAAFTVKRLFGR